MSRPLAYALLADPETRWKPGFSAMAAAQSWEAADSLPAEVAEILGPDAELLLAIPEHRVSLPGGGASIPMRCICTGIDSDRHLRRLGGGQGQRAIRANDLGVAARRQRRQGDEVDGYRFRGRHLRTVPARPAVVQMAGRRGGCSCSGRPRWWAVGALYVQRWAGR